MNTSATRANRAVIGYIGEGMPGLYDGGSEVRFPEADVLVYETELLNMMLSLRGRSHRY